MPIGAPPARFAPAAASSGHRSAVQGPGEDPELARARRKPVLAWALAGTGIAVIVALVVSLVVTSLQQQDPLALPAESAMASPSVDGESSFETSSPVEPAPGSDIPIAMDAKLPGLTVINPPVGDWRPYEGERVSGYTIESADGQSYLSVRQWSLEPSHYRDQDLTMGEINNAVNLFGSEPKAIGEPGSHWLTGNGYRLELMTQRVGWDWGDNEALLLSRYMPNTGVRIMIIAFGRVGDLDNPNSPISRKLAETSFTVP